MRSASSSKDAHEVRPIDERKKVQKSKSKVSKTNKEEDIKPFGYFEKRGMTKENKEKGTTITPQELFRKQIAENNHSKVFTKLQNDKKEKNNENDKEEER